ncbi:4-hydroxythreonine-4-phosphate dehydrogenase PdxA [Candidatus Providencia siddallii]|uniref:4-hydroxythreonine-4-phosphate dehydrogenase n=1 Tax=Candidatus Providencia siddallii TaxID=1715285 RepID=A0ABP1CFQ7_9GAMM
MKIKPIIITAGEPAGIGPDLLIQIIQKKLTVPIVACIDPELLFIRSKQLNLSIKIKEYSSDIIYENHIAKTLFVLPVKLNVPVKTGILDVKNSAYVIKTLLRSYDGCLNGEFSAIVTGPVHKGIINKAGINFTGHTEFFAKYSCCEHVVMMFVSKYLKVALVTTHLRLKDVSKAITKENLFKIITVLNNELKLKFNIKSPKIYVCGLNPHAGDDGYIGTEEIDIIKPVLNKLKTNGINLIGPISSDTLFLYKNFTYSDVILVMYHDQGIPALKYKNFGELVNITLGLPVIRTSVDHGTALNLAGTSKASSKSFLNALNLAIQIVFNINEKSNL